MAQADQVQMKKEEINSSARAWIVAIVAIIASILISVNNNKLPATSNLVLPAVMGGDPGKFSFLMSLNGYVGFVLSFIAASIIVKFGTKKSTLMVLGCALVGAVVSAASPTYEGLVVGRLIEGVGYACIGTVIPVLFSEWFPPSKRGIPNGIFSVWVPLGSMFILATSGFFFNTDPQSYHNVFWFVVVLLAVICVVWVFAVRQPEHNYLAAESARAGEKPKVSEGFKSPAVWAAMVAFAAFALGTACVMNFELQYMISTFPSLQGLDPAAAQGQANGMFQVANISIIVGGVAIGFALNKVTQTTKRLVILAAASLVLGACFAVAYIVPENMFTLWMVLFGLSNGVVPAVFFTMVAEIAPKPQLASVSATLMSCGQCVGGIVFGVVGAIVASGWSNATGILSAAGAVLFIGVLALLFLLRSREAKRAGL